MFVVHQNDNMATKVEDICYRSEWSDEAKSEMIRIRRTISDQVYNYGSTDKCNAAVEEEINVYKKKHPEELLWIIYINGVNYGEFYSEHEVCNEYHQVIDVLRNKERVYQIRRSDAW